MKYPQFQLACLLLMMLVAVNKNALAQPDTLLNTALPLEINTTVSYDDLHRIESDIVVKNGGELKVLEGGIIALSPGKKIIVEPGGRFFLNGTITSGCNGLIGGVEIWGNPDMPQDNENQGYMKITGGVIENASIGVLMGKSAPGNPDSDPLPQPSSEPRGGGILLAENAIIRNNRYGVVFHSYPQSNQSYFKTCTFETSAMLLQSTPPEYFISLYGVSGIDILGCSFENIKDNWWTVDASGNGIYAFNSAFTLNSMTTATQEVIPNTFKSLHYGVYATGISFADVVTINNCDFLSNFRNVYLGGLINPVVTQCEFFINTPFQTEGGYGLYLDECTGYSIEDNLFFSPPQGVGTTGVGIIVNNSGEAPNVIYRNDFVKLEQGISTQGINRNLRNPSQGLQLLCNKFINCDFDMLVPEPAQQGWGIAPNQGANSQYAEDMAGNLFDIHGQIPDWDFDDINNQGALFNYYYPDNNNDNRVIPVDYTTNSVTVYQINVNPSWTFDNGCPETTSEENPTEEELRTSLNEATTEISATEQALEALVDGGDTEELYQEIEFSTPPETMAVYNEMMETSPYLSDSVVGAAIEKENVIPGAMLRDVMVANPHSAKSDKLIEKLDQRYTPLPDYLKAQILESRNQVSMKEKLESQLAKYRLQKKQAFTGLVQHYMQLDSIAGWRDSIVNLLMNDNELQSKYHLAFWQLYNGEYEQSINMMNIIPEIYNLQGEMLTVYDDFLSLHNMLSGMMASDSGLYVLAPSMVQQLTGLAQSSAPASVFARNILVMSNNMEYMEPIQVPDLLKSAEAEVGFQHMITQTESVMLRLHPNPADDYAIIEWVLDEEPIDLSIKIRSLKGELMKTIAVRVKKSQEVINTQTWPAGIYLITLINRNIEVETVKLTLIK